MLEGREGEGVFPTSLKKLTTGHRSPSLLNRENDYAALAQDEICLFPAFTLMPLKCDDVFSYRSLRKS